MNSVKCQSKCGVPKSGVQSTWVQRPGVYAYASKSWHRFGDGGLKVENRQFIPPHSQLTPLLGVNLSKFRMNLVFCKEKKTRVIGLSIAEVILMLCLFVLRQSVTDRQTDGQTDGHLCENYRPLTALHIHVACYATARVKMTNDLQTTVQAVYKVNYCEA